MAMLFSRRHQRSTAAAAAQQHAARAMASGRLLGGPGSASASGSPEIKQRDSASALPSNDRDVLL
jgi:hypothetical protein